MSGFHRGPSDHGRKGRHAGSSLYILRSGLENYGGDSEVDPLWATITCVHVEFVHVSCMLDCAERLACGHKDPRPCIVCRSDWPARSRPPHPAEMAEDLPRPPPGGGWPVVRGALPVAELLEEDGPRLVPVSYVPTGSRQTFEQMTRIHERNAPSSCLVCSQLCDALGLPQEAYLDFPRTREWDAAVTPLP